MTKSNSQIVLSLSSAQASAMADLINSTLKPSRALTSVRDQIMARQESARQELRFVDNVENADTLVIEMIDEVIELYSKNIKKRGLTDSAVKFVKGVGAAFNAAQSRAIKSGLAIGDEGFIATVVRPLVARIEKISYTYSESEDASMVVSDNHTHAKQRAQMAKHATNASIEAFMGLTDYNLPTSNLDMLANRCDDALTMLRASQAMLDGRPRLISSAINRIYEYERLYDMLPSAFWNFIGNHSHRIALK